MPEGLREAGAVRTVRRRTTIRRAGRRLVFAAAVCALLPAATACGSGGGPDGTEGAGSPPAAAPAAPGAAPGAPATGASRSPAPPRTYPVRADASVPGSAALERARQRGVLIVGIRPGGAPLVAEKLPARDLYSGFDIEIVMMIAADLGFPAERVRVMPGQVLDYARGARWNPAIDLYVGAAPDGPTDLLEASAPYYTGGQALLVRRDDTALTAGRPPAPGTRVCVAGGLEAEDARRLYPQARVQEGDSTGFCVASLRADRADAVFGADPELRGWTADQPRELRLVPVSPGTRRYVVAVAPGETALRDAIDASLRGHRANGDVRAAYDATLGLSGLPEPAAG